MNHLHQFIMNLYAQKGNDLFEKLIIHGENPLQSLYYHYFHEAAIAEILYHHL